MKWGLLWSLLIFLSGCVVLQHDRGPGVGEAVPPRSPTMLLLQDAGKVAVLDASEITVLVPPDAPANYWTCLRLPAHRSAARAEVARLILAWRWQPNLSHKKWLEVPHMDQGFTRLRSVDFEHGLADGIALEVGVRHTHNGNVLFLSAPLPPLSGNPCGHLISPHSSDSSIFQ